MLFMDEYTDAGGGYRHDKQIGVDIQKDGSAEYKDQNHETQEHHADSKHHGRYIFRYFMRLYPFAFAGKDGNGSGAAIQTTDNTRN